MIRLQELREERGWKMTEAAKHLKKAYTTYVNHEKGFREPSSEDLKSYAMAYNVSVDYLLGRSDDRSLPEDAALSRFPGLTPEESQILDWYRRASEFDKGRVYSILEVYEKNSAATDGSATA